MVSRSSTAGERLEIHDGMFPRSGFAMRRALRPRLRARGLARVRGGALDAQLVRGADPAASEALAARAALLTARRTRLAIAGGLERAARAATGPQRRWWAVSPHGPLAANVVAVSELAELLRSETPVYAAGVAAVNQLITDGTGPAYLGAPQALGRRLREARAAMLG